MTKLFSAILFSISLCYSAVCAGEDKLSNEITQAWTNYHNGDISKAIEEFDRLSQEIGKTPDQKNVHKQFILLATKLDICHENYLFDCVSDGAQKLKKILDEVKDEKLNNQMFWIYVYYLASSFSNYSNEKKDIDKLKISSWLEAIGGNYFIRFNLLLSELYLRTLDRNKSIEHLDVAMGGILAKTDLTDLEVAKYLNKVFVLLTVLADPAYANQLYSIAGNYIEKQFLTTSLPNLLQYRLAQSAHLYATQNLNGAIEALKQAEKIFNIIKVPEITKIAVGNEIYQKLAISCYFINDLGCASAALEKHPYNTYLENNEAEKYKNDDLFSIFLAIKLAVDLKAGTELTDDFLALFEDVDGDDRGVGYPYKLYALALKKHAESHGSGDELAIKVGELIIERDRQALISTDYGFRIPHAIDNIILADTLYAINRRNSIQKYSDLALKIVYSHNRGLLDVDTEAIERLAKSGSQENKRLVHSKIRLADKFRTLQLTSLENEISFRNSNAKERTARKEDYKLYKRLSVFSAKLKEMNMEIKNLADNQVYGDFPDIGKLQASLHENEAYLTFSSVHDDALSLLCATKDDVYLKVNKVDSISITRDMKLIYYAMTATHQPSTKLDSQYPVESAINLYHAFVSPMSECLMNKTNLIWSPDDRVRSFPISALLASAPKKTNSGWRLDKAEWLGLTYGITYAGSTNRFIHSRALREHTKRDNSFFGIGDPNLKTLYIKSTNGLESHNAKDNAAILRNIKNLEELPETGNELREIKKTSGKGSKILTRDSATEINLRRELLNEYSAISLASHGVLKNEVSGINQESLILTPVMTNNASKNGILTSSEIADLNLSADLVVLSACNSANEEMNNTTKGITGLSTAFAIAGSPTIMASLWSVHSKSTRRLMTMFHKNYFNDKNKNIALSLRDATRSFIKKSEKQYAHPRYWAAFVVFGDGGNASDSGKNENRSIKVVSKYIDDGGLGGGGADVASLSDDGDFIYVGGHKNYNTDIWNHDSYIYKFDIRKNKKVWERKNIGLGDPPQSMIIQSMIAYDDGLIFSSQRGEIMNHTYIPTLSSVDAKGNLLWQKDIGTDSNDTSIQTSLSKDNEGNLSLVIADGLYKENSPAKIKAYKINPDGSVKLSKTVNTGVPNEDIFSTVNHLSNDGKLFISVSYSHSNDNKGSFNEYGLFDSCNLVDSTNIIVINKDDLAFQSMHHIDNLRINKIRIGKDGEIIAVGMRFDGCKAKRSAIALRITPDSHEVIYERKDVSEWTGTDINISHNNNYIFSGVGKRTFAYDYIKPDVGDDDENEDTYFIERLAFLRERQTSAVIEPFIDIFDSSGTIKSKTILQFGASMEAKGAIIVGENLMFYGDISDDPTLIKIAY